MHINRSQHQPGLTKFDGLDTASFHRRLGPKQRPVTFYDRSLQSRRSLALIVAGGWPLLNFVQLRATSY